MIVHPLRSPDLRLAEGPERSFEPKVAVILNANARRVTERVTRALRHVVPEEDLFISRTAQDCRRIAQTVLDRSYEIAFTGGGDGTFVAFANEVLRQVEPRSRYLPQRLPKFGVLKLGTGNGLASLVSASSARGDGILDDVLRARAGEIPGYKRLDLISVEGRRTPFAGLGVDGKLLNDYIWVKQNLGKGMLKPVLTGAGGYFSSVAFKTVPYYLTRSASIECEVQNGRSPAYKLRADGSVQEELAPGEVLYRGRLMMCAAATMPFYGFGMRMFPFAGKRRGHMHLRLGVLKTTRILANLPGLWQGRWFPEDGLFDYFTREYTVRFATPMAFQIGGDAEGYRDQVTMSVDPAHVELVDFTGSVH